MKILSLALLVVATQGVFAQAKIDSPEALKNWLPASVLGFEADPDSYSAELLQQNTPYFIAAKKYTKGSSIMSIVVFDYRTSSDRVKMALDAWEADKKNEDAGLYSANVMVAGCKAQEFVDKEKKSAQLYIYHQNRYLITLSSGTEDISFLKSVAENLKPTSLSQN